jgi:ATP-binding cassette subfamily F protein 3
MRSKDVLKDALKEFDGTVIVVSHDREFLDGLVEKVYEFGNQGVKEHLSGIYEFLAKTTSLRLPPKEGEPKASLRSANPANSEKPVASPSFGGGRGEVYEARKEQQKLLRRLEKKVSGSEETITRLETEIQAMEAVLVTPEGASNVELLWKHAEWQKKLSAVMDEWTEATIELENYQS